MESDKEVYLESDKVYLESDRVYLEPDKVYLEPDKVWLEPNFIFFFQKKPEKPAIPYLPPLFHALF